MQYDGIDLGFCSLKDIEFLHESGIRWDELENAILREESRRREENESQRDVLFQSLAGLPSTPTMFEQAYQRALERERQKRREG